VDEGKDKKDQEGAKKPDNPTQLIGNGTKDRIGEEEVPLRDDVRGCHHGVRRDEVVRLPEQVRVEQHEANEGG